MDPRWIEPQPAGEVRRRRLRAVFAADIANFGGLVSVDETKTLDALVITRRIALQELEENGGWLFGLPGDGIFALFESALAAVRCALNIQAKLAATPKVSALRMRIGVHLGEVLFHDEMPFGESLCIAARLESMAEPGSILVSASVMEAVSPRLTATFTERGIRELKHSPRRITTFSVTPATAKRGLDATLNRSAPLDSTVVAVPVTSVRKTVGSIGRVLDTSASRRKPLDGTMVSIPVISPAKGPETKVVRVASVAQAASSELVATAQLERTGSPRHSGALADTMPRPRLPKATPLVLPERAAHAAAIELPAGPASLAQDAAAQALLSKLALILTNHIGPFAKILVKRHATDTTDPELLLGTLAAQIPAESERIEFLRKARELLDNPVQ